MVVQIFRMIEMNRRRYGPKRIGKWVQNGFSIVDFPFSDSLLNNNFCVSCISSSKLLLFFMTMAEAIFHNQGIVKNTKGIDFTRPLS